jgi:hypothetical protein
MAGVTLRSESQPAAVRASWRPHRGLERRPAASKLRQSERQSGRSDHIERNRQLPIRRLVAWYQRLQLRKAPHLRGAFFNHLKMRETKADIAQCSRHVSKVPSSGPRARRALHWLRPVRATHLVRRAAVAHLVALTLARISSPLGNRSKQLRRSPKAKAMRLLRVDAPPELNNRPGIAPDGYASPRHYSNEPGCVDYRIRAGVHALAAQLAASSFRPMVLCWVRVCARRLSDSSRAENESGGLAVGKERTLVAIGCFMEAEDV